MPHRYMTGESIKRTFLLLDAISTLRGEPFTVKRIMAVVELPHSTVYRYLPIFVEVGILAYEKRGGVGWYCYCYKRKKG